MYLYSKNLAENSLFVGMPLCATGLWACTGTKKVAHDSFGRLVGWSFVFYWVVFHALANLPLQDPLFVGVQMRFWMQVSRQPLLGGLPVDGVEGSARTRETRHPPIHAKQPKKLKP